MATQWKDFSVHSPIRKLYMLQCINKNPYTCCPATKHAKQNTLRLETCEKNQRKSFDSIPLASNLAPLNNFANLCFFCTSFRFCHTKELQFLQERKLANLSRMFVTAKNNKDLFTPTLNGITASVSLVFLSLVVLNHRLSDWLWSTQIQRRRW